MFNVNGAVRCKYVPGFKDMRAGYDRLCAVVRELNGGIMEEGTVYIFTSRTEKLVKAIRHEHPKCQLYIQKFDGKESFITLKFRGAEPVYDLDFKYTVMLFSCPVVSKIDVL